MASKGLILSAASIVALGGWASAASAQNTDGTQTAQATPAPGTAQDQASDQDTIVVTGIRGSLATAQRIKRTSDAVVDSIVAQDIGKLPDNTVSDALQRVTGVQVQHSAGETQNVLIRGLPDIESFINGREIFTGTGRGVALQDIPAELVAGVDVYKTSTPEMIEGGVAGRIDIRLRRPFDFSGLEVAGTARAIYSDQSRKWSYIGSLLVSDRWQTAGGSEFGILIGVSYNRRRYEDQTAFNFGFNNFSGPATGGTNVLIPDTVGGLITDGDRKRPAANFSVEWRPNPNLLFYIDGLYTGYREDHDVDFFVGLPKAGNVVAVTTQGSTLVSPVAGQPAVPVAGTITTRDNFTIASKQTFHSKTDGYQLAGGMSLNLGPAVLSTELTYNDSKFSNVAYILDGNYVVPQISYNFNNNGTPHIQAMTASGAPFDLGDQSILDIFQLFDQRQVQVSRQIAWRADLLYNFNAGPLKNFKVGVRYARRTGRSDAASNQAYFIGRSGDPFSDLGMNANSDLLDGDLGVGRFALPSSRFIRDNIDLLRGFANRPSGPPPFDPTQHFDLTENYYAFYGQLGFKFDVGRTPVEGVLGARVVNTDSSLNAILVNNGIQSPTTGNRNEVAVLPSLSVKATPLDNLVLRFVAGKSLTRPQFGQLNPATSLAPLGVTGTSSVFGSGGGGNPDLRSIRSDNLDGSIEWYFSRASSLTLAGFYRRLNGYIQTYSAIEIHPGPLGEPETYLVARPRNTGKGSLKGIEAAYQQFFDFLPGPLSGFGVQANFTLSEGKVPGPPDANGVSVLGPITPVSRYSYNLVAIYEKYGISARLAYNWRSKYVDSFSTVIPGAAGANPPVATRRINVSPLSFLDFSASYDINDRITLTVDATNILDERYHDQFGQNGVTPRDTRQYDRTFGVGVRFRL